MKLLTALRPAIVLVAMASPLVLTAFVLALPARADRDRSHDFTQIKLFQADQAAEAQDYVHERSMAGCVEANFIPADPGVWVVVSCPASRATASAPVTAPSLAPVTPAATK